jgi:hypothetical protein
MNSAEYERDIAAKANSELGKLRAELFELLQSDQGHGFVSDSCDHCHTLDELIGYAEGVASHMQRAANKARAFARRIERKP